MIFTTFKQHWPEEENRLVYQISGSAPSIPALPTDLFKDATEVEARKAKERLSPDEDETFGFSEEDIKSSEATRKSVVDKLTALSGPKKYREEVTKYVERFVKGEFVATDTKVHQNRMIEESCRYYNSVFNEEISQYYSIQQDHETFIEDIRENTKDSLKLLREDVEAFREILDTGEDLWLHSNRYRNAETVPDSVGSRDLISEWTKRHQFYNYIDAIADYYMNEDQQEALLTSEYGEDRAGHLVGVYSERAGNLTDAMKKQCEREIEIMYNTGTVTVTNLKSLQGRILSRYREIAKFGGSPGSIELGDLAMLDRFARASNLMDNIPVGLENEAEWLTAQLISHELMSPGDWETAVRETAEKLAIEARNLGNEEGFIAAVKKQFGITEDIDFEEAAKGFRGKMQHMAIDFPDTKVNEILKIFKTISEGAHTITVDGRKVSRFDYLQGKIRPPALQPLVISERAFMLNNPEVFEDVEVLAVLRFLSKDREGREELLSDPIKRRKLFSAIQSIQNNYERKFEKERYGSRIPPRFEDLTTGYDRSHPTEADMAARLLSIISLSHEAEFVTRVLRSDLEKELENAEWEESEDIMLNLKYDDPSKLEAPRFVSTAAQNGFSGVGLALTTGKVLIGITMAAAVFKCKGEDGWLSEDTVGNVVDQLPLLAGGYAGIWTINQFEKDPGIAKYITADEAGRERIRVGLQLDGLEGKAGRTLLTAFLNRETGEEERVEFAVMKKVKKDAEGMINMAERREPGPPRLSRDDLKDKIPAKYYNSMTDEEGMDQLRYLFYKKFVRRDRHITGLQTQCDAWASHS